MYWSAETPATVPQLLPVRSFHKQVLKFLEQGHGPYIYTEQTPYVSLVADTLDWRLGSLWLVEPSRQTVNTEECSNAFREESCQVHTAGTLVNM